MRYFEKVDGGEAEFFSSGNDSFAMGFVIVASSVSLGRSPACMLIMEFVKASCIWEMKDEMEQEPIRLWRAVVGHLMGRPWMVWRILQ